MLVGELRRRLVGKVEEVAGGGDEEATAVVLAYSRAMLIALAGYPVDQDLSVRDLTVGTRTAALILGLHREYVRMLVRCGRLKANKVNGEFQFVLSDLVDYIMTRNRSPDAQAALWSRPMYSAALGEMLFGSMSRFYLWRSPPEETSA